MSLNFNALVSLVGTQTKSFEGQTPSFKINVKNQTNYTDGLIVDTCDLFWFDQDRELHATTEEIDLSGSLTDAFGDAIVFAKVCGMYIHFKPLTVGATFTVGGAAANTFLLFGDPTDVYEIGPDGKWFWDEPSLAGKPVTAGTGDLLKLDSGASPNALFDIAIWGRSA